MVNRFGICDPSTAIRGFVRYIEGKLQTEGWTDKATGLKKVATPVVGTNFDVIREGTL